MQAVEGGGLPPLYLVRKNVIRMMASREYIVEQQDKTPDEYVRDFCVQDEHGTIYVDRDAMSLSLVNQQTRKPMRVFFFGGQKCGKKEIEAILTRMGDAVTRAVIVLPDGSVPTPQARKVADTMNRSDPDVFIQWFLEQELQVDIQLLGKTDRRYRVLTPVQKASLFKKYDRNTRHFPFIAYDDPIAKYYGLQRDDVLECVRPSETAGKYAKYQICRYPEEVPKASKPDKKKQKS